MQRGGEVVQRIGEGGVLHSGMHREPEAAAGDEVPFAVSFCSRPMMVHQPTWAGRIHTSAWGRPRVLGSLMVSTGGQGRGWPVSKCPRR